MTLLESLTIRTGIYLSRCTSIYKALQKEGVRAMGKFKVHLKVQALELEIEGERPDIPAISTAVSRQITNLIQPAAALTSGEEPHSTAPVIDAEIDSGKKLRPSRKRPSGSRSSGDAGVQAIEFRHDPEKYGNPQQSWTVTQKAIWLLYVLKGIQGMNEVSAAQLVATFNEKFKKAKTIHPPHLPRDLGTAKVQNPAPVGENKGMWYLTNEGDRQAQQLIQGVLAPTT